MVNRYSPLLFGDDNIPFISERKCICIALDGAYFLPAIEQLVAFANGLDLYGAIAGRIRGARDFERKCHVCLILFTRYYYQLNGSRHVEAIGREG